MQLEFPLNVWMKLQVVSSNVYCKFCFSVLAFRYVLLLDKVILAHFSVLILVMFFCSFVI